MFLQTILVSKCGGAPITLVPDRYRHMNDFVCIANQFDGFCSSSGKFAEEVLDSQSPFISSGAKSF